MSQALFDGLVVGLFVVSPILAGLYLTYPIYVRSRGLTIDDLEAGTGDRNRPNVPGQPRKE